MSSRNLPASGLAEDVLLGLDEIPKEYHLVTFSLGEEYGVPIGQIQEIVRVVAITRVPNSPPYMEGVINLRGRVLPVLNLRRRLKLSPREMGKSTRIIVTEIGNKVIGLLVDAVSHVIRVPAEAVEPPPEEILEVETDYITGVGKIGQRMIILLDLQRLLRREKIEITEAEGNGEAA